MKKALTPILYLLLLVVIIVFITGGQNMFSKSPDVLSYDEFFAMVEDGLGEKMGDENSKIAAVQITQETLFGLYKEDLDEGEIDQFKNGKTYDFEVTVSSANTFKDEMARILSERYDVEADRVSVLNYGFDCQINPQPTTSWFMIILPYLILFGGLILFYVLMMRAQGGGKQIMNFGKSRARSANEVGNKVTFADVAGADEEKQELEEIVEFLKSPKRFSDMGARIPKGVLLIGPPGTGKTLLAKAIAGEADVPFFFISSSEFVEMYVGVGASRIRDLFATAKRSAPAIVFIDELDAVGRQRGTGLGGGHDEREQTLNQLLVEMDGFSANEGIIVIAATNRPDVLDPALLRPGRFDRQVVVDLPDVKGREEILKIHSRNKHFEDSIDMSVIAKLTAGCTGADLENILNEAAIFAVRRKHNKINMHDIDEAIKRVLYGTEKKSRVITQEDKRITAYHEVGHAIVAHVMPHCDGVHELSIIPRGQAAGYTRTLPSDTYMHMSRGKILDNIAMLLGGRAAESIALDDICTGASNDLKRATEIARSMVVEYGMSEKIGHIYLAGEQEVFIGKEWGHQRSYSETFAADVDEEVRRIVESQYERAISVLSDRRDALDSISQALIEREEMTGEEFVTMFNEVANGAQS